MSSTCDECMSPRLCEDDGYLTCIDCGLVKNGILVFDEDGYQQKIQSEIMDVEKPQCGKKRESNTMLTGSGMVGSRKMQMIMSVMPTTAIEKTFDDVSERLELSTSTLVLAKEMFQASYETSKMSFKGESRRPMIVAACILFAMRDRPEGALRKDEICDRLGICQTDFGKIADKLQTTLLGLGDDCNAIFKKCLTRDVSINDMLGRMLCDITTRSKLAEKQKKELRKLVFRLHDKMDVVDAIEFKTFQPSKQLGGIISMACMLLKLDGVRIQDIATVANVCDASIKASENVVRNALDKLKKELVV